MTVALCLSLVAHAGAVWTLIEGTIREARARIWQPPIDRGMYSLGPLMVEPPQDRQRAKPPAELAENRKQAPTLATAQRVPIVPAAPKPDSKLLQSEFGEADGVGDAAHSADGDHPMLAKHKADETQAFLSRDPAGAGRVGDPPSQSVAPRGDGGTPGRPGKSQPRHQATPPRPPLLATINPLPTVATPQLPVGDRQEKREKPAQTSQKQEPDLAVGVPQDKVELIAPRRAQKVEEPAPSIAMANPAAPAPRNGTDGAKDEKDTQPREARERRQAPPPPKPAGPPDPPDVPRKVALVPPVLAMATPTPGEQAVVQPPADPGGAGGKPGTRSPSADPAPMSDSESDAFGKVANVEFSDGRVQARFGRRIKTVRPKLLLSARYEMFAKGDPRVLLSAKVDATGHVTNVDIYQSSGSPDLDQPCLVALYDWWFEPPKDRDGKPLPDVVVVAITFRTH